MAVVFKSGQTLTDDDLKIAIRDSGGNLIDPFYIRYSIFDYTTGVEVLIGAADRVPATSGTGLYYVNATLPLDSNIGDWLVRWNFRETAVAPLVQVVQEFNVVKDCPLISKLPPCKLKELEIRVFDSVKVPIGLSITKSSIVTPNQAQF